jgi:hypothetical protein
MNTPYNSAASERQDVAKAQDVDALANALALVSSRDPRIVGLSVAVLREYAAILRAAIATAAQEESK